MLLLMQEDKPSGASALPKKFNVDYVTPVSKAQFSTQLHSDVALAALEKQRSTFDLISR